MSNEAKPRAVVILRRTGYWPFCCEARVEETPDFSGRVALKNTCTLKGAQRWALHVTKRWSAEDKWRAATTRYTL